jgi:hypothetical protein
MKTKIMLTTALISAGLLINASAFARGPGGAGSGNRGASCVTPNANCDLSGRGQGTPLRDGSGKALNNRGNLNSTGTPLRDGSGRVTAPGKGPKNGSGNQASRPVRPAG